MTMIRVGFWYDAPTDYTGGLNYFRNLLYALSTIETKSLEPVLFIGKRASPGIIRLFEPYAEIVATSLLDRGSLPWLAHTLTFRLLGSLGVATSLMQRHQIAVVSHASDLCGSKRPFKVASWIPDFQCLHFPEFFPPSAQRAFCRRITRLAALTDITILSSRDAYKDFLRIAPMCAHKVRILPFVSQPDPAIYSMEGEQIKQEIEARYGFVGRYFFLPNQLWEHKNHRVVFEATRILKRRGHDIMVICSGNPRDHRTGRDSHAKRLAQFIVDNSLEENVKLLGLIDYRDVQYLLRNAVSVINPSLFEGWSSSVEEAKSIGKNLILSDLAVHREQAAPAAVYFDPENANELADILLAKWVGGRRGPDAELEVSARRTLLDRTRRFAMAYQDLILQLVRGDPELGASDAGRQRGGPHSLDRFPSELRWDLGS